MKKNKEIKLSLKKEKVSELNKDMMNKIKGGYQTYEIQCATYPTCYCWTGPKRCR
jgi:natural product precursor